MANRRKIKTKWQKPNANISVFSALRWVAYAEILFFFGLTFSFNSSYFIETYNGFTKISNFSSPTQTAIFFAPIILFFELFVLVFRWMFATCDEFDMWELWLEHPITSWEKKAVFFGLPVVLGILPAFPNNIVFISGFMTVYSLANYWTQWLSNDHFYHALQKTKETQMHKAKSEVLVAMEHFWLKRPQLARIVTMMFFNFIAFSLALAGSVQQEPQRHRFQLSAYAVLILVLFTTEIVIAWWRYKLDQNIQEIMETAGKDAKDARHTR